MCGLTGFLTTSERTVGGKDRAQYMRQTLIVDSLRGFHSTGVFWAKHDSVGAGWAKACEQGSDFVDTKNYVDIERKMPDLRFAVGHNRWATMGAVDDVECAHPFQEDNITLVHNGTLDVYDGLITSMELLGVEVDSHAICHNMSIHGAKETIEQLNGAFTLIWHDSKDNSLNFCRNADRPLTMWMPNEGSFADTIYFGSESKMMEWIMSRNHITTVTGKFIDLPTGEIWKFLPESLLPEIEKVDLQPSWSYWNNRQHYQGGTQGKKPSVGTNGNLKTSAGGSKPRVKLKAQMGVTPIVNKHLNKEGFDRTDRLPFVPTSTTGNIVVGTIDCLDTPAFLIGATKAQAHANFERRWTVRPTGMRYLENFADGGVQEVLIVKLYAWYYHDSDFTYGEGWLPQGEDEPEDDDIPFGIVPDNNIAKTYPLGNGIYGARDAWYNATKDGCSMCRTLPGTHTADHIVWLDDNENSFLCAPCSANHL